jgi:dienelactone hydrolase
VLWIESQRAVVSGDTLVDFGQGLELTQRWLREGVRREEVLEGLRPLLALPVEHVLATHGGPFDPEALVRGARLSLAARGVARVAAIFDRLRRTASSDGKERAKRRIDMAEVLLFHHAQGQTAGFHAFADELRQAGHTVHTPDLFDGRTFDSIEDGVGYAEEVGFENLIERGVREADGLPTELVYGGFSLGVLPAQKLTQTRAGARGGLFFYSLVPTEEFGSWPEGVPAQIHGMDADPYFAGEGDIDAARVLVESTEDTELFVYPGDQHYFADASLPSYDNAAATLLVQRVLTFLEDRA